MATWPGAEKKRKGKRGKKNEGDEDRGLVDPAFMVTPLVAVGAKAYF